MNNKELSEQDLCWMLLILSVLYGGTDFIKKLPQKFEPTEEELKIDEEYTKAGACERAIKQNRSTLQHGGYPMIKKEGNEIRCHGYIYGMNECVCRECEACKIQYGHPYDPYWNDKESFIEYDEESKRIQKTLNKISEDLYKGAL